jgi:two-component system, OmpR family, catabolic regulation response regulator CreB
MPERILLIEDEPAIADTIVYALKTEGFDPLWCATGAEGRAGAARGGIALVILDIGLPDANGLDLCREIRTTSRTPVIFLTARASEVDRVVGLELGADDYVVKPFSPRELVARVRAVLRRSSAAAPAVAKNVPASAAGRFAVDVSAMTISYHGTALELARTEFRILQTMVGHPGRVFSRRELMEAAWDQPEVSLERTVDTHIKTIRRKLEHVRPGEDPIETRRGFGYAVKVRPGNCPPS